MKKITVEEYKKLTEKKKYNNRKVEIDGIVFDSVTESERYLYLRNQQKTGKIEALEVHKRYTLVEKGTNELGQKYSQITYTPDFVYACNERMCMVAEDVKGMSTEPYRIRRKLFMKKYPHILFVEVK